MRKRQTTFTSVYLLLVVLFFLGCEKEVSKTGGGNSRFDSDLPDITDTSDIRFPDTGAPAPPGCGDGHLTREEACDDGNQEDGDGCAANCLAVSDGYTCNPPGEPCRLMALCGDGYVLAPELCDDGNNDSGDGCSDLCQVEIGFKCTGSPSVCTPTICGDNIREGAEGCDDGNAIPFDGCDARCQVEANCEAGNGCTSICGDGLVLGEQCDDGNNLNGDGCSATCEIEPGYECIQPETGGVLEVPVVYKDFDQSHPDFEPGASNCVNPSKGMVANQLGLDGKPVMARSIGTCGQVSQLSQWYDHSGGGEAVVVSTIKMFENSAGGYVNRWGDDGTQWVAYSNASWCDGSSCANCNCGPSKECIFPGLYGNNADCVTVTRFDGTPFFYPMDNRGVTPLADYSKARICDPYAVGCVEESAAITAAGLSPPAGYNFNHNFHFTSEVRFWFQYDSSRTQVLEFTGDDDFWVFVNGSLALDLGGIHSPVDGTMNVGTLGLVDGQVYEIAIFHAERQTDGSSFRLTLNGFNTSRSECRPVCGDGIVGLGEQCDDGVNDGGYGECNENCLLGQYCGDGIVQEDYEDCDDGNFVEDDLCPASCRLIGII